MIPPAAARPDMLRRLARSAMLLGAAAFLFACPPSPEASPESASTPAGAATPPHWVAHGGGSAGGQVVTNSLEALEDSVARGHTFIEVDFSWTLDDRLVLMHDWQQTPERLFGAPPGAMTHDAFMSATNLLGLTQLDADGFFAWLERHPAITIVTDVKGRSEEALARIARQHPALRARVVPQLYTIAEDGPVVAMGYPRVILTLYASPMTDEDVLAYAREHAPLAVTMPLERAAGPLPRALDALGVFSYAHTTSDYLVAAELFGNGIDGMYTDYLSPQDDALAWEASAAPAWTTRREQSTALERGALTFLPMAHGLRGRLLADNPGDAPVTVTAVSLDAQGKTTGDALWTLPPGSAGQDLALDPLLAPEATVLQIQRGEAVLSMRWDLFDRPPVEVAVVDSAARIHTFSGPADGLFAQAVLIHNPTRLDQLYRCEQRFVPTGAAEQAGRGTRVRSTWTKLHPGETGRQVFGFPGPGAVELRVSGGPSVVAPLRWSPGFSILR